jgi:Mn-dependent DtxR family transcriptional regulator
MGRPQHSHPLPPVEFIQQAFALRQDGRIVRRECHIAALADGPATFIGPGGRLLARVYHQSRIRRIAAGRIAWALAVGQWPKGVVRARNGVDDDLRPSNLIETKRGPRPFDQRKGGKRSSLHERQASDAALLRTLAEHQGALTVPQLSQSLGQSAPCCCARLAKLERRGLVCGPHCNARHRWNLTAQGEALASSANPVVLDDRDRQVLAALALTSMGTVKLARRVEVCPMTIRRRVRLLVEKGLVFADPRKFFSITDAGLAALGDTAPQRWVDLNRLRASLSKDVLTRSPTNERTTAQIAAHARMARGRPRGGKQALMRAMAV